MKYLFCAALLSLTAGCATTAPESSATVEEPVMPKAMYPGDDAEVEATDAVEAESEEEPDVICRWVAPTGSRIKKKVCTTRAQREQMRKDARDFIERARVPETVPR